MKTVTIKENQTFLGKLIDKLKNSALFSMAFDEDYGSVDYEENEQTKLQRLSKESNTSESELSEINKAFAEASNKNEELAKKTVSKIPEFKKDSSNPFKIDNSELIHDDEQVLDSKTVSKNKNDREIAD